MKKKLLYYSPFIPIIGLIVHMLWPFFRYEIYSVKEKFPKFLIPTIIQGICLAICFQLLSPNHKHKLESKMGYEQTIDAPAVYKIDSLITADEVSLPVTIMVRYKPKPNQTSLGEDLDNIRDKVRGFTKTLTCPNGEINTDKIEEQLINFISNLPENQSCYIVAVNICWEGIQ